MHLAQYLILYPTLVEQTVIYEGSFFARVRSAGENRATSREKIQAPRAIPSRILKFSPGETYVANMCDGKHGWLVGSRNIKYESRPLAFGSWNPLTSNHGTLHANAFEREKGGEGESSLFFFVARGPFRLRLLAQSLSNMQDDPLLTPIFAEIARRRKWYIWMVCCAKNNEFALNLKKKENRQLVWHEFLD